MYRELISHTTSRSNQGARHAQVPMKIALSEASTLAFAHTPVKVCAHGTHACVMHTRGSGRCCVLTGEKRKDTGRYFIPAVPPRDTFESLEVCACEMRTHI